MRLGRHPRQIELAAWFDGEGRSVTGSHIARCASCRHQVDRLAEVRSWIRVQPLYRMGPAPVVVPRSTRPVAIAIAVAMLAAGVAVSRSPRGALDSAVSQATQAPTGNPSQPARTLPVGPAPPTPVDPVTFPLEHAPALGFRPPPSPASAVPPAIIPARQGPLRLALVIPTAGPKVADGAELERTVRARIETANATGGIAGFPISLVVVPAEDQRSVWALAGQVDALVGGFGADAPAGVPWILPADPAIAGPDVLSAEATDAEAGSHLAVALGQRGLDGPIGVIIGPGGTGFADGLASQSKVLRVAARDPTCITEVAELMRAGVSAMAIAGNDALASGCASAAGRLLWRPHLGVIVPPSAAYASARPHPSLWGARTLLSMPWPTTSAPGAARFRTVSDATSYRSLVSFAGVELAIDVARRHGSISIPAIATAIWPSDLLDLAGTTSRGVVVVAGPQAWTPEP